MPPRYYCHQCNLWFNSYNQLVRHYLQFRPHPFCQKCQIGFADREEKVNHWIDSDAHEYCRECDRAFDNGYSLQHHYTQSDKHPTCCGRGFADDDAIAEHYFKSSDHAQCKATTCRRGFFNEGSLAQHLRTSPLHKAAPSNNRGSSNATGTSQNTTAGNTYCTPCASTFADRAALEQHLRDSPRHCAQPVAHKTASAASTPAVPSVAVPAKCYLCQITFSSVPELYKHWRDSKAHVKCLACDRGFFDKESLKVHHMDSNHKHCEPCSSGFVNMAALFDHFLMSRAHPTCEKCNRGFVDDVQFKGHLEYSKQHNRCRHCRREFPSVEERSIHKCPDSSIYPELDCKGAGAGYVVFNATYKIDHSEPSVLDLPPLASKPHEGEWCPRCNEEFGSLEEGMLHRRSQGGNHNICKVCLVDYPSATLKNIHMTQANHPPDKGADLTPFLQKQKIVSKPLETSAQPYTLGAFRFFGNPFRRSNVPVQEQDIGEVKKVENKKAENTNRSKSAQLNTPCATPGGLVERMDSLEIAKDNEADAKKAEERAAGKENVRPQTSQKIKCGACPKEFSATSEMAAHMESAEGCLYHDETGMYSLVLRFDKDRAFTVPGLIGYLDGSLTRVKAASKDDYDSDSLCYNCPRPGCDRSFGALEGLDNHLKGPIHDIRVYRCPRSDCDARFSRMGTLLRHIEESDCKDDFAKSVGGMASLKNFVQQVLRSGV